MSRIACGLDDILTAARAALVTASVITDAQAFLSVDPDELPVGQAEPPLLSLSFAAIDRRMDTLHAEEAPDDPITSEMEMHVTLWTRVALDQAGEDTLALTNATYGMAGLIRKTVEALNARDLTSGANTLTWRPLIFLGVRNKGRKRQDPLWRSCAVRFNICWEWRLTP